MHFCASSHRFVDVITLKMFALEKLVKFTEYNFHNSVIRRQVSKSINVIFSFFIFPKILSVRTKMLHKNTTQSDRKIDKAIAIDEITKMLNKSCEGYVNNDFV